MFFKEHDIVHTIRPIQDLPAETVGTIVFVYETKDRCELEVRGKIGTYTVPFSCLETHFAPRET